MTTAPERIWADANRQWSSVGWSQSNEFVGDVEYVRADIASTLTAERDRLRAKLADAAVALDAAGMELSDFANCLSREPWAAGLAYEAAIDARSVMKGETP